MGPGIFLEGPDLLFDTTDEIRIMLNRASVSHIGGVIYTHWHPDHTAGWRILEILNTAPEGGGVQSNTAVYIPEAVWHDFENQQQVGMAANLNFLARDGLVCNTILKDKQPIQIGDWLLEAIPMNNAFVSMYAFLVEWKSTRLLLAVDHVQGWQPPARLANVDVAVLESGWSDYRPDGTETKLGEHFRRTKTSLDDVLRIVQRLKPKRTFLTHIPEYYGWTYDDYMALQRNLASEYPGLAFAYDGLVVNLV